MASQNARHNANFSLFLFSLPALASIPYFPALFQPTTTFLSLLALSSLASTAFLLHRNPPTVTGIAGLDAWARSSSPPRDRQQRSNRPALALGGAAPHSSSPAETWLPYLNACLCALLVVVGLLASPRDARVGIGLLGLGNLPALVYAVVLVAKVVMASVDPERELSRLKYEYKGA